MDFVLQPFGGMRSSALLVHLLLCTFLVVSSSCAPGDGADEGLSELAAHNSWHEGHIEGFSALSDTELAITGYLCQAQPVYGVSVAARETANNTLLNVTTTYARAAKDGPCKYWGWVAPFAIPLSRAMVGRQVQIELPQLGGQRIGAPQWIPHLARLSALVGPGGDTQVPQGVVAVIDRDFAGPSALGLLRVHGTLSCPSRVDEARTLVTDGILVMGASARFVCGGHYLPAKGELDIRLRGQRDLRGAAPTEFSRPLGERAIVATQGGTVALNAPSPTPWTRATRHVRRGDRVIRVGSLAGWKPGDRILVATTSYHFDYAHEKHGNEVRIIESVDPATKSVTVNRPFGSLHWGETSIRQNGTSSWKIDQRAYVANLSRRIRIRSINRSAASDQQGGHLMAMGGGNLHLNGVVLAKMGQMGKMGRYPVHWHRQGNGYGQYVRNSVIRNSFQRCVTVHATDGVSVEDNVCFNHFSHGFFLEDGNEQNTQIRGNLSVLSKAPPRDRALLDSDVALSRNTRFASPAAFWISHPNNVVEHNVAVASEGSGFWMSFAGDHCCSEGPRGSCELLEHLPGNSCPAGTELVRPSKSSTLVFRDNTAMSCAVGMTWDGVPEGGLVCRAEAGGTCRPNTAGTRCEGACINPTDRKIVNRRFEPESTQVFPRLQVYKSRRTGLYYRGFSAVFDRAVLADNGQSAFFAFNQGLRNSLVVGHSENSSEAERNAMEWGSLVTGIKVYDGPFDLDNVHFADFDTSPRYASEAQESEITATPITLMGGAARYVNTLRSATMTPQPFYPINLDLAYQGSWRDGFSAAVRDERGDLLGRAGVIRPIHPLNDHPSCIGDARTRTLTCDYRVGHVRFLPRGGPSTDANRVGFEVRKPVRGTPWFTLSPGRRHSNKVPVTLDPSDRLEFRKLDWQGASELWLIFTTDAIGDRTPQLTLHSAENAPCDVAAMVLSGSSEYSSIGQLRSAKDSGFSIDASGSLHFALAADRTRDPYVTPGAPNGITVGRLVCR